ncbi:hypothetical protein ACJX0J_010278, partial [Zea mays]
IKCFGVSTSFKFWTYMKMNMLIERFSEQQMVYYSFDSVVDDPNNFYPLDIPPTHTFVFAMNINKTQVQTILYVGIYLPNLLNAHFIGFKTCFNNNWYGFNEHSGKILIASSNTTFHVICHSVPAALSIIDMQKIKLILKYDTGVTE